MPCGAAWPLSFEGMPSSQAHGAGAMGNKTNGVFLIRPLPQASITIKPAFLRASPTLIPRVETGCNINPGGAGGYAAL